MDSTIYCELLVSEPDLMGYTTYVFKCLENNILIQWSQDFLIGIIEN